MSVEKLSIELKNRQILQDISFDVMPGEWLGIIGPNGSGKSTLLRALVGFIKPTQGVVRIDNQSLVSLSPLQRARTMAYIQQETPAMQGFKVRSFLNLAYHPLQGVHDRELWLKECERLCEEFQLKDRWNSSLDELSGGERQRVMLVQSLLQMPKILLLDELTNHLDIYFQMEIMHKLQKLAITKITVLHDLNLAARFCDRILMLQGGQIFGLGAPNSLFTQKIIFDLFGVDCQIAYQGDSISYIRWT